MSLTQKQIYDLNNMNVASQNVALGTTLNNLIEGSSGGDIVKIEYDSETMTAEELGGVVLEVFEDGKIPVLDVGIDVGEFYLYCTNINVEATDPLTATFCFASLDFGESVWTATVILEVVEGEWQVTSGGSKLWPPSNIVYDEGQTAQEMAETLSGIINAGEVPTLIAYGYLTDNIQYNLGGYDRDNISGEIISINMVGIEKDGRLDSQEYAFINTKLYSYANNTWSAITGYWRVAVTPMP